MSEKITAMPRGPTSVPSIVGTTTGTVHFDRLDYISSAGLSVLLHTQQRLAASGHGLRLAGMNPHVRLVFEYAGLDSVFPIE